VNAARIASLAPPRGATGARSVALAPWRASAAAVRQLLWRYPEWWSLAVCAAAWVVLVVGMSVEHHGQAATFAQEMVTWLLMVLAMMLPLVVFPIRATAARSLWPRRDRAIGGFLIGYLGPWLVVGVGVGVALFQLDHWSQPLPWLGGIGFATAAVWQISPVRLRAVRACHRTVPLAPHGWRADRDCLRFGWQTGCQCLISCWALMAACALVGHTLAALVCTGAIGVLDRYVVRPRQRTLFAPLLGMAVIYGVLGLQ